MTQARKPKGTSTGGQFANKTHDEAIGDLTEQIDEHTEHFDESRRFLYEAHMERFAVRVRAQHPEAKYAAVGTWYSGPGEGDDPSVEFLAREDGSLIPNDLSMDRSVRSDLDEGYIMGDEMGHGLNLVDLDNPAYGVRIRDEGLRNPLPAGSEAAKVWEDTPDLI